MGCVDPVFLGGETLHDLDFPDDMSMSEIIRDMGHLLDDVRLMMSRCLGLDLVVGHETR